LASERVELSRPNGSYFIRTPRHQQPDGEVTCPDAHDLSVLFQMQRASGRH
jgi:hypothetical protein